MTSITLNQNQIMFLLEKSLQLSEDQVVVSQEIWSDTWSGEICAEFVLDRKHYRLTLTEPLQCMTTWSEERLLFSGVYNMNRILNPFDETQEMWYYCMKEQCGGPISLFSNTIIEELSYGK